MQPRSSRLAAKRRPPRLSSTRRPLFGAHGRTCTTMRTRRPRRTRRGSARTRTRTAPAAPLPIVPSPCEGPGVGGALCPGPGDSGSGPGPSPTGRLPPLRPPGGVPGRRRLPCRFARRNPHRRRPGWAPRAPRSGRRSPEAHRRALPRRQVVARARDKPLAAVSAVVGPAPADGARPASLNEPAARA